MKVTVLTVFIDKITKEQYQPGQIVEIADKSRIKDLETRGLAKAVEAVADVEKAEAIPTEKKRGKANGTNRHGKNSSKDKS